MSLPKKKDNKPKIYRIRGGRPGKIHKDENQYDRERDKKQQEKDACLEQ